MSVNVLERVSINPALLEGDRSRRRSVARTLKRWIPILGSLLAAGCSGSAMTANTANTPARAIRASFAELVSASRQRDQARLCQLIWLSPGQAPVRAPVAVLGAGTAAGRRQV